MVRLNLEQRLSLGKLSRQDIPKKFLMASFGVSRQSVWYWGKQDLRTRFNIPRNYESKVNVEVEATILFFRSLGYGTARIQQRLFCASQLELKQMEIFVQGTIISRTTINKVLTKHRLNGYKKNKKSWKFFRAKYPNELWQLDIKQFKFQGKKYYFVVLIDDYSRFLLKLQLFDHSPKTVEICQTIERLVKENNPKSILTDNNPFKEEWKNWCLSKKINSLFAHPYYPQDKGKVERAIRNIAEELVNLIVIFKKLVSSEDTEAWRCWFNEKRFHRGIKDFPANLYVKN